MPNTNAPNPYESPLPDRNWSWWDWLRQWFPGLLPQLVPEISPLERLLQGKQVFVYGVVLQLPLTDPTILTAAMPLAIAYEDHAQRNIREAQRVLRHFIAQYPDLRLVVQFRKLVIRHVADYSPAAQELRRDTLSAEQWQLAPTCDDLKPEIEEPVY